MALHHTSIFLQLFMLILLLLASAKPAASQAKPGCQHKCGNVSLPYPFGTTEACSRGLSFFVNCTTTIDSLEPKPFLGKNVEVMNISLLDGELRVGTFLARDCYDADGKPDENYNAQFTLSEIYTFSEKRNKFTVVGCDTYGYIRGFEGKSYSSGCISLCNGKYSLSNDSCSGIGCCQTSIPKGLKNFKVTAHSFNNHTYVWSYNPCSYSFLVEEKSYNFSIPDLINLRNQTYVPVIIDWVIDNITCEEAAKDHTSFACKQNSKCVNADNTIGYRCNCSEGFQGNPYLEDGCQDLDECGSPNDCEHLCHNLIGSYNCSCRTGYHGDGKKNGEGCTETSMKNYSEKLIKLTVGVGVPILALFVLGCWLYWRMRERKLRLKEKNFEKNGGLLLQNKLGGTSSDETAKLFTIEELKKATNDFDDKRVIGQGGFGTVYKGVLPKNRLVAIKKSKIVNQIQSEQFVNEVILLFKINHINVVKILGCCLETEVPLLVYEFITNGTLSSHIHNGGHASLSWRIRLGVASETAGALAYLHSESPPIVHRDVKPSNILLDKNYSAKVSDFGDSILIPAGEIQLDTLVKGTIGYLDPEYLQTGQLSEKSDVYSFGVVLVELLTGENTSSSDKTEEKRNLVAYFISSLKRDRLFQILDARVANEGSPEQIREVAKIAESCLRMRGEERPMMKEVAMQLEGLRRVEQHQFIEFEMNLEETKRLVNESSMDFFCSSSTTTEFDSLKNQGVSPFEMDAGR